MIRLREENINTADYWTKQWPTNPQWVIGKQWFTDIRRLELLARHIQPTDLVLDVGGGRGEIARWIKDRTGCNITVADFSATAVKECMNVRGIPAVCVDFKELPTAFNPDTLFDVVISGETLEHVENPADFIRHLVEVCKPGGMLVVTTPINDYYPTEREHIWSFDDNDMANLLTLYGEIGIAHSDASIVGFCKLNKESV